MVEGGGGWSKGAGGTSKKKGHRQFTAGLSRGWWLFLKGQGWVTFYWWMMGRNYDGLE